MNTLNITKSDLKSKSKLEIYDALGTLVFTQDLFNFKNAIDIASFKRGIYKIKILSSLQIYTTQIMKK